MHRSRNILAILGLTMLFACIKPFDPVIDSNAGNKYVISGRVTNTEGWQVVEVSLSSPIDRFLQLVPFMSFNRTSTEA